MVFFSKSSAKCVVYNPTADKLYIGLKEAVIPEHCQKWIILKSLALFTRSANDYILKNK